MNRDEHIILALGVSLFPTLAIAGGIGYAMFELTGSTGIGWFVTGVLTFLCGILATLILYKIIEKLYED